MISLKHFAAVEIFKRNFLRLSETCVLGNQVPREFHQFRNLVFYRKKPLNLSRRNNNIILCQFSNKISKVSEKNLIREDSIYRYSQVEEEENEYKNELEEMESEVDKEELFAEIAGDDPDALKKLKLLEFEMAILKGEGGKVPEKMKKEDWLSLLNQPSLSLRKQFLSFLRSKELSNISTIEKAKVLCDFHTKKKQEEGFHYYGLGGQTMLLRIYPKSVNRLLSLRQMMAEQTIVFDCSYQNYMDVKNTRHCAKQIFMSLSSAKIHQYPCNIKLCNFNENDYLGKILPSYVTLLNETFGADTCKESYLDLYPRDRLVYLSPHASCEMTEFRRDKIYIIGAYVDQGEGKKASFAKAKESNVRMAKLPLDYYLSWKLGNKNLPLNIVLNILLDMNYYNDWNKALRHIPSRCFHHFRSKKLQPFFHKPDLML